jgi:hypothetical protein
MSESSGLQPTDQGAQPQAIDQSTHHVIAMPDGNTIALPKSLPLENVNSIAAMYHTLTREVGAAGSMLNPVSVGQGIAQGAIEDVKGGHIPLIHSMLTEPIKTAAKYYYDYAAGTPESRIQKQSDMLDVAPEAIGQSGGMAVGGKLIEGGGKFARGAAPVEGAEGPTMPRSQILKNEVGATTVDAVSSAIKNRPFQEGGEEGVIRSGKGRKGLGGGKPEDKYHPDVVGPKLLEKYGESDGDPAHTAAILPDGTGVAMPPGAIHDEMLGGKTTDVPAPREVFVNGGGIRMRPYGVYGDRSFNMSIPDSGVTTEQLEHLNRMAPQMGSGKVYIETPSGKTANIEYGKAGTDLEKTMRGLVPIKGEEPAAHPFAEMRAQHLKNGGATFSADGSKNLDGTDAWSVGVHPDRTENVAPGSLTPDRYQQFADKNADLLAQPDHAIGSWKDEKGNHILDVTKLIKDDDEAKAAGAAANQKSIFHLKTHELVQTGGTGEEPMLANNASGGNKTSLEDVSRRAAEAGAKYYDVDSRKMDSQDGWRPLPNNADMHDLKMNPKSNSHIVKIENGEMTDNWSGDKAGKLPTQEQISKWTKQPEATTSAQTPYEKASATTPEYRAGLQAKQISPRYTEGATAPTLGRTAMDEAGKAAPSKVGENGETKLGYTDKMGLTLSKYANEGLNHEGKTAPQVIDDTIKHYTGNLSALWDAIPDSIKRTSQKWYEAAHGLTSEISRKTGVPHEKVAGVVSVFSPQNEWSNNLGNAERFIQRYQDSRGHAWTDAMDDKLTELRNLKRAGVPQPAEFKKALDFVRGKRYDEIKATDSLMKRDPEKAAAAVQAGKALWLRLVDETEGADQTPVYSPEGEVRASTQHNWGAIGSMTKALQILEGDGSPASIGEAIGRGHKTRNFYNNIINPWSEDGHLTIDTHAVRAAHLKAVGGDDVEVAHSFGTSKKGTPQPPTNAPVGIKGTYPIHEEAYRNVAKEKGVRPNQAQSVLWEGIRSLLGEKPQAHVQALNDIWRQVGDGKMTAEQARQEIINAVGGFKKPEWMSQEEWDADESRAESFNFGGK